MQFDDLNRKFNERRFAEVIEHGAALLARNPADSRVRLLCANASLELGRLAPAIAEIEALLERDTDNDAAWHALGRARLAAGDAGHAAVAFLRVGQGHPLYVAGQLQLAGYHRAAGEANRADDILRELRSAFPRDPRPVHALASVKALEMELEQAIELAERACALAPASLNSLFLAADCARLLGRQRQCRDFIARMLAIAPNQPITRLLDAVNCLPHVYRSEDEIAKARALFARKLERLSSALAACPPSPALCRAFSQGMYNLPYQGQNDRELQQKYGDLAVALHGKAYPQWAGRLSMPAVDGRIRVGFVSAFFCRHSNWRVPIKGWVSQLNRDDFELFGYSVGSRRDAATAEAEDAFEYYFTEAAAFERMAERIRSDRLHVLIYPEIGMSAEASRLAMLRLAPMQCTSWGHPNTSGLSTVDYFLSSELMEPDDAQEAYSEKLVCLPNSSVYIDPEPPPAERFTRADFGLRDAATVYLCIQYLSKYLPQFDTLLTRIAGAVPDSQFVFLEGTKPPIRQQLAARLRRAFEQQRLDYEHHVHWLPHLPEDRFRGLQRLADVFLDTPEWSGCNTALEAIDYDLPIVTLPGRWMRGRHCYAFLRQIGVEDTIASSEDDYVNLATGLATRDAFRRSVRDGMAAGKQRLFRDAKPVTALEEFLRNVVQSG